MIIRSEHEQSKSSGVQRAKDIEYEQGRVCNVSTAVHGAWMCRHRIVLWHPNDSNRFLFGFYLYGFAWRLLFLYNLQRIKSLWHKLYMSIDVMRHLPIECVTMMKRVTKWHTIQIIIFTTSNQDWIMYGVCVRAGVCIHEKYVG